ncbi:MAG: hypothetical protein ACREIV_05070, partial [Planctomycetaceae bacterium]
EQPGAESASDVTAGRSLRDAPLGTWRPTALLPNDLSDPPRNYPHSFGGACIGMTAVTFALWAGPIEAGTLTPDQAAARVLRTLQRHRDGRYYNYPLPSHLRIDGRPVPLLEAPALLALVETVQRNVYPEGIREKSPADVRRAYRNTRTYRPRLDTRPALLREIEENGGRLVAGLIEFNAARTEMQAHAVVFTLDARGEILVWDPNARMEADAPGSGRPVPLRIDQDDAGRIAGVSYAITLPDGSTQQRRFEFVFPLRIFIEESMVPAFDRSETR